MTSLHENHWTFGIGAHLEFVNGTIVSHPQTPMLTTEGSASISDPQTGALLFFSDGTTLWDANHNVVAANLGGHQSSTHSLVIVPPPSGANFYHVFATGASNGNYTPNGIIHSAYSVTGTGSGLVVSQVTPPTDLLQNVQTSERIAVTTTQDCGGYWILTQELASDTIHRVLLSTDTPQLQPAYALGAATQSAAEAGYMKFSPNGNLLAFCDQLSNEVLVCDFDCATGVLSPRHRITDVTMPYGLEFSPDSQLLYFSMIGELSVFQVSIGVTDVPFAACYRVHDGRQGPDTDQFGALQLAPNGRIYACRIGDSRIAVIRSPNTPGVGCDYSDFETDQTGSVIEFDSNSVLGLPTFARISDSCQPAGDDDADPDINLQGLFPWFSASVLNHHSDQATEPLTLYMTSFNKPGPDLTSHQSLSPLNADAQLVDISVFKDANLFNGYTDTIVFSLVVLDFQGNVLRTISTATIDFQSTPDAVWLPVALSTNPSDTTILTGEVVAGQLQFGSQIGGFGHVPYQMTGRGRFV